MKEVKEGVTSFAHWDGNKEADEAAERGRNDRSIANKMAEEYTRRNNKYSAFMKIVMN